MKRAHKNILGLSGLGLVAAVTTFAATLPAPTAGAVSSVTDTIQLTVVPTNPAVALTGSGGEVTEPNYNIQLTYTDLMHIQVTLMNLDSEGSIIYSETLMDEGSDWMPHTASFDLNLDDYGGKGNFVVTATGTGYGNVYVEDIISFVYTSEKKEDEGGETKPGDGGDAEVDTDVPISEVKSVKATLYTSTGLEVWSATLNNPAESETLDFSGFANGIYTLETISRDGDGNVLERLTRQIIIDNGSGTGGIDIPVEDPGVEMGKAVVTVTDEEGKVVYTTTVDDPSAGDKIHIDTDSLEPGTYTITTDYYDKNDELVKTTTEQIVKSKTNGEVEIPIEQNVDVVTQLQVDVYSDTTGKIVRVIKADRATGTAYIYDANGNLLFTIPNGYRENMRKGDLVVPMEGLDAGDYTAILMYKTENGRIVGNTKKFKIHYDGDEVIIVPDTGSFFQGLNISREDYLITGVVVFAVIGVVAFGVVARNRNSKKVAKNRR